VPALTKEDWDEAFVFGCYIDVQLTDGDGTEPISNSKLDKMRKYIENSGNSGLFGILKNYTLFEEDDIVKLLGIIYDKSETTSSEWRSISRVIYYEYMNPKPSGIILEELSL
tara:strand:- start:29 stop:364 length:336 start_codon:yes stop_codon:yes gene_type:complete